MVRRCRGGVWVVPRRTAEHDHEQLDAAHPRSAVELHPATPPPDSELAQQVAKDPYAFELLGPLRGGRRTGPGTAVGRIESVEIPGDRSETRYFY